MLVTREKLSVATTSITRTIAEVLHPRLNLKLPVADKLNASNSLAKPSVNSENLVAIDNAPVGISAEQEEMDQVALLADAIRSAGLGIEAITQIECTFATDKNRLSALDALDALRADLTQSLDVLWEESLKGRSNTDSLSVGRSLTLAFSTAYFEILRDLGETFSHADGAKDFNCELNRSSQTLMLEIQNAATAFCDTLKWCGLRHEAYGPNLLVSLGNLLLGAETISAHHPAMLQGQLDTISQTVARAVLYHISDPYSQSLQQVATTFDFIDRTMGGLSLQRHQSHPGDLAFDPAAGTVEIVPKGPTLTWINSHHRFIDMKELRSAAFDTVRATTNGVPFESMLTSGINRMRVVRELVSGKIGKARSMQDGDRRIMQRRAQLRPASLVLGHLNCVQSLRAHSIPNFIAPSPGKPCVIFDESANGACLQLARSLNLSLKVGDVAALHSTHDGSLRVASLKWFRRDASGVASIGIEFIAGDVSLVVVAPRGRRHPTEAAILVKQREQSNTLTLIHRKGFSQVGDVDILMLGIHFSARPIAFETGDGIEVVTYRILQGEN